MIISLYERLSATDAFTRLLKLVQDTGTTHQAGQYMSLRALNVKTITDMTSPLVGVQGVDYGELINETMGLVDEFFISEPHIIKAFNNGGNKLYYWRHNKFFSIKIAFLKTHTAHRRHLSLNVEYSHCDTWYHFPRDVFNLSVLAAKICLLYYQETGVRLNLGRLKLDIGQCYVRTDELDMINENIAQPTINTPPLILDHYYDAPVEEGWPLLVEGLRGCQNNIDQLWSIKGCNDG